MFRIFCIPVTPIFVKTFFARCNALFCCSDNSLSVLPMKLSSPGVYLIIPAFVAFFNKNSVSALDGIVIKSSDIFCIIARSSHKSALLAAIIVGLDNRLNDFRNSIISESNHSVGFFDFSDIDVKILSISDSLIPKPVNLRANPSEILVRFCSISFVSLCHSRSRICLNHKSNSSSTNFISSSGSCVPMGTG